VVEARRKSILSEQYGIDQGASSSLTGADGIWVESTIHGMGRSSEPNVNAPPNGVQAPERSLVNDLAHTLHVQAK